MRHPFIPATLFAIVGAVALWGCGGGGGYGSSPTSPTATTTPAPTTTTTTPPATSGVTVAVVGSIGNNAFLPNPVRANSGDVVSFKNNDTTTHHIVMDDGTGDLGDIAPGSTSRSFTVRNASALNFHCTIHTSMVGSINGVAAPTPDPGKCYDSYGYEC